MNFQPLYRLLCVATVASAAHAASIQFTATDINPVNTSTQGWGMNSSGTITGSYAPVGGSVRAFIYYDGQMHDVPTPQGFSHMEGQSINDANQIGGTSWADSYPGFVYGEGGPVYPVGAYGGSFVDIWGFNNSNTYVGGASMPGAGQHTAFVISGGMITNPLASVTNALTSSANAINNQGLVVGTAVFRYGNSFEGGDRRAFSWDNGQLHWLDAGSYSGAYGVSSNGLITGTMGDPNGSGTVAFLSHRLRREQFRPGRRPVWLSCLPL